MTEEGDCRRKVFDRKERADGGKREGGRTRVKTWTRRRTARLR